MYMDMRSQACMTVFMDAYTYAYMCLYSDVCIYLRIFVCVCVCVCVREREGANGSASESASETVKDSEQ